MVATRRPTRATIARANFQSTTDSGFTQAQFESTASYASGELVGVRMDHNDLTGWNFADKNLTDASFSSATLSNIGRASCTETG